MFYQFIDREFLRGEAPQWSSEASKHSAGASKKSAQSADFFASIIEKQQSNTNGKYLLIVLRGREDNYNFRRILHELSKQPEKQSIRKLLLPGHEVINSFRAHETLMSL